MESAQLMSVKGNGPMRILLTGITLWAMVVPSAVAHAGFLLEASVGKGYQASTPRGWAQTNLMLAPGFALSSPILSMVRFQLGVAVDFADVSGTNTDMELRPMVSLVPPVLPIYGRLILVLNNLLGRTNQRELAYGGAVGVRIGIPSVGIVPSLAVFAEGAALPRSHEYGTESGGTQSRTFWVLEGRAGACMGF
jgi:hypothetical protein